MKTKNEKREALRARLHSLQKEKKARKAGTPRELNFMTMDAKYKEKYPHYVPGSLRRVEGTTKVQCDIKCMATGVKRAVFTSDLHQVKYSVEVTKMKRAGLPLPGAKKRGRKAKVA